MSLEASTIRDVLDEVSWDWAADGYLEQAPSHVIAAAILRAAADILSADEMTRYAPDLLRDIADEL